MRPSQLDLFGDPPDVVEALRRVDRNRRRRGRRWELEYGLTDSDRCRAITLRRGCDICSRSDALVVGSRSFPFVLLARLRLFADFFVALVILRSASSRTIWRPSPPRELIFVLMANTLSRR